MEVKVEPRREMVSIWVWQGKRLSFDWVGVDAGGWPRTTWYHLGWGEPEIMISETRELLCLRFVCLKLNRLFQIFAQLYNNSQPMYHLHLS